MLVFLFITFICVTEIIMNNFLERLVSCECLSIDFFHDAVVCKAKDAKKIFGTLVNLLPTLKTCPQMIQLMMSRSTVLDNGIGGMYIIHLLAPFKK